MDSKPQFIERPWEYFEGYSTGVVTIAEVRRAPYHRRIKNLTTDAKELAEIDLRELHSRGWRSRLTVYDFHSDGRLPGPETSECVYTQVSNEYHTRELEEIRARVLQSSVPCSARLVTVENILPPVVEALGCYGYDPELFSRHIGSAWGDRSKSISASSAQSSSSAGSWLDCSLPYPWLVAVSHPTALKPRYPAWREDCLRRGARFLQCRQLLPILDNIDEGEQDKIQCIAFEHITVSFNLNTRKDSSRRWEGIVLFPNAVKGWKDGKLKVDKYTNIAPRGNVRVMQDKLGISQEASKDPDVSNWLAALRLLSDDEKQSLTPFNVLELLWREVLDHWHLHLSQIALVVETLSSGSPETLNELGLRRQQQLKAVIVQGISMLADIDDSLRQICLKSRTFVTQLGQDGHEQLSASQGFEEMRSQFMHVKNQLERHGPTLEHYISVITQMQQRQLAETQLEESRKAIQQADTIKRLTVLAFIYIPIQTASSIFGMNLKELQPNPSIWVYIITCVIMLIVTLTAAGWRHFLEFICRLHVRVFGSFRHKLADALGKLGMQADWLRRNQDLDARRRTPQPSWYEGTPFD